MWGTIIMRREDREVTDPMKITEIISRCTCCRIGFNDDGEVYIVPLNFGYETKENTYVFYFHGANEGRKIDLIQKTPMLGLRWIQIMPLMNHLLHAAIQHVFRVLSVMAL